MPTNDGYEYEIHVMNHHQENTKQITYHWKFVGEYLLFESGFIHKFNEHRKKRLLQKHKIGEFGFDGISYDTSKSFYGIQAKNWHSRKLTAKDLGSFLSSVMCLHVKSKKLCGYLYHTNKLQIDFSDNSKLLSHIYKTIQLPFDNNIIIENKPIIKDLYPYQIECVNNLISDWSGIGLICQACGSGKGVIMCHSSKYFDKIIVVSPLKISVEQTHKRLIEYVPTIDNTIFDSDYGTFDETMIDHYLKKDKYIISTTFRTAKENLYNSLQKYTFDDKTILYIDEAHNLTEDDIIMIEKLKTKIKKIVFVTACNTELIDDIINYQIYKLPLSKAIKDKIVCDYQIYLPLIEDGKLDIDYKLNEIDDMTIADMLTKILFMVKNMLMTGSKKCIVYLSNIEESKQFMKLCKKKLLEYHGIKIYGECINANTSHTDRNNILTKFQNNLYDMSFIYSIRILDEAIDIVKCDSIFITKIGEHTSDKRTIQRICRANRTNIENPNKIANVFLWCNDYAEICNALNYIKNEDDYNFYSKIKCVSINYDNSAEPETINKEKITSDKLVKYIKTKCMTLDEIWNMKFEILSTFSQENKRLFKNTEIIDGIRMDKWQDHQKQNYTKNLLSSERKEKILSNPYFKSWTEIEKLEKKEQNKYSFDIQIEKLNEFTKEHKQLVTRNEENYSLFLWQNRQKEKYNKNKLTEAEKSELLLNPYFKEWSQIEKKERTSNSFDIQIVKLNEFTQEHKRLLKQNENNYYNLYQWQDRQKRNYNQNKLTEVSKSELLLNPYFKAWTQVEKKAEVVVYSFDIQIEKLNKFTLEHKRLIKRNEDNYNNLSKWQEYQKIKYNQNKLIEAEKSELLANIYFKEWTTVEKKNILSWDDKFILFDTFTKKNERLIQNSETIDNINIGKWFDDQKQLYKKNKLLKERKTKLCENIYFLQWTKDIE